MQDQEQSSILETNAEATAQSTTDLENSITGQGLLFWAGQMPGSLHRLQVLG